MEGDMRGNIDTSAVTDLETLLNGHSGEDQDEDYTHSAGQNKARVQRRRTSKACDHCNSSRRKCDGHQPCGYCVRTKSSCEYRRQAKKRGKVPAAARDAQSKSPQDPKSPRGQQNSIEGPSATAQDVFHPNPEQAQQSSPELPHDLNGTGVVVEGGTYDFTLSSLDFMMDDYDMFNLNPDWNSENLSNEARKGEPVSHASATEGFDIPADGVAPQVSTGISTSVRSNVASTPHPILDNDVGPRETYGIHSFRSIDENGESHIVGTRRFSKSLAGRSVLLNISRSGTLPKAQINPNSTDHQQSNSISGQSATGIPRELGSSSVIRFPVLRETIGLLRPFIPDELSLDLLEAYFKVSPMTEANLVPCVPPLIYRRRSFLRYDEPRQSSHVLLVSMLWLAAQTADIPMLNASIPRRKYVRRKLLELTTKLLKSLNEVSLDRDIPQRQTGAAKSGSGKDETLDEIMAYVHLAMVTSASEFKGASLRWWNIAFSLAREPKLHQEISTLASSLEESHTISHEYDFGDSHTFALSLSEERKEERRRVWWFLYSMDRHLSLSYNKPLALLDSECQGLRRPCDDKLWQSELDFEVSKLSATGPSFECNGPSFFGFFMPLMALLGEIVYFVGAQHHPRFGISQSTLYDWQQWEKGISDRLDAYVESMQCLLQPDPSPLNGSPNAPSATTLISPTSTPQVSFQNRVTYAYAKLIIHVLHILLAGKWDALSILDRSNPWASSPAFIATMSHVVEAAEAAEMLLDLDPDAYFMPFFLGIFLFQGSLHLCVAADRLKTDAAEIVVKACETMIRIHIVRMPSEYQTLFVSALRLGLKEMRGRNMYVSEDPAARRIQVFRRYRWTSEAKGLAV